MVYVKQFSFSGVNGNMMKEYVTKYYCCSKCHGDVMILIDDSVKVYQCNKCGRLACNPRIYYKLDDRYKTVSAVKQILSELNISLHDHILYRGKIAVLVAVCKNFLEGREGVSKNIKYLLIAPEGVKE